MTLSTRIPGIFLFCVLALAAWKGTAAGQTALETPERLQQLVAPIALYPDELVAQILAASTYPVQIVEANRWLQENSGLQADRLADEVNQQSWDPSVKALTQFPSVLANMDRNLSWTSALGDAYFNQQEDVLNAVQVMRKRAKEAGNLKSTPEEVVTAEDQTIGIEPAEPEIVYVPEYNPWIVYGAPVPIYPDYIFAAGIGPPFVSFGIRVHIGPVFGRSAWGWHSWGFDWRRRVIVYNRNLYVSQSRTFFVHKPRVPGIRPHIVVPPPEIARRRADRGFVVEPHGQSGTRSGAFSGYEHGGTVRSFSSRGRSSLGGGAPSGAVRPPAGGGRPPAGGGRHR